MNDDIHSAVRARQPDYPPEQSMGGINAYNFGCKPMGFSPGYCVCLNKIMAYERDGNKLTAYPDCEKAIRNKDCPALGMRQEERVAGKALYFLDRNILREEMDKHFKNTMPELRPAKATPAPRSAPKAAPVPSPQPTALAGAEDGYAAAINAAIAQSATEQPKQEEPKAIDPSASEQPKRLSLVEMARLQMGKSA